MDIENTEVTGGFNDKSILIKLSLMGLLIFVFRFWLVYSYSGPVPFWDQWDAEGRTLYLPYLHGQLDLRQLFSAHNEHRIVLTRLVSLGLLRLTGRWDPQLQMIVNSIFYSFCAMGLALVLCQYVRNRQENLILVGTALLFIAPFAWENTLAGFQSQFYFLFGFSTLSIWGLVDGEVNKSRFWIGIAASILACLSMASGFLAMPVVIMMRILAAHARRESIRFHLTHILFAVTVIMVNLIFTTRVPGHDILKAQSMEYLMIAMAKAASWPLMRLQILFLFFYAPSFNLMIQIIRGRLPLENRYLVLIGLTSWVLLQAFAIAYSRGRTGILPASRYQDLLMLGALVNFAILYIKEMNYGFVFKRIWLTCMMLGLAQLSFSAFTKTLPAKKMANEEQLRRCVAYMATGDMRNLTEVKHFLDIPYPDAERLAEWLDDPDLRRIFVFPVPGGSGKEPIFSKFRFYETE